MNNNEMDRSATIGEGYLAWINGAHAHNNPYREGTLLNSWWAMGFSKAEDLLGNKRWMPELCK